MGIVLRKSFKGQHFWIQPIPQQQKDMLALGFSESEIKQLGIDYQEDKHHKKKSGMVKIDAMFFSATEEPCKLIRTKNDLMDDIDPETGAKGSKKVDDKYLDYDTFILCNPNAMSY